MQDNKNKDNSELQKALAKADEYLNGWKRALADYENHKKSTSKQAELARFRTLAEIFDQIIPIVEFYRHALWHIPADQQNTSWFTGLKQLDKQWADLFTRYEITVIAGDGSIFDPAIHEAVETEKNENMKDQEIIKVLNNGYYIQGQILRPAKVVVNSLTNNE